HPLLLAPPPSTPHRHSSPTRRSPDLVVALVLVALAEVAGQLGGDRVTGRDVGFLGELIDPPLEVVHVRRRLLVGRDRLAHLLRRSEEHTSELQSPYDLVCRLLLEKKK